VRPRRRPPRDTRLAANAASRVVAHVDRVGSRAYLSSVVIDRTAVSDGREAILGLAELLGGAGEVCPTGVILAERLLTDAAQSPLFHAGCGPTVVDAVWEVAAALGADAPPVAPPVAYCTKR
jgi:hypothetical protein